MIVAVSAKDPVAVPVTIVDVTPPETDAIAELLLPHVPPALTSLKFVVSPWHTARLPDIADGNGFTVTTAVIIQLVGKV